MKCKRYHAAEMSEATCRANQKVAGLAAELALEGKDEAIFDDFLMGERLMICGRCERCTTVHPLAIDLHREAIKAFGRWVCDNILLPGIETVIVHPTYTPRIVKSDDGVWRQSWHEVLGITDP